DRAGQREPGRDAGTGRLGWGGEIGRLRGEGGAPHLSARNRLRGTVSDIRVEGLIAQVELVVDEPARLVAIVTADAVEELGLKVGMQAAAVVKATSVMVEHS